MAVDLYVMGVVQADTYAGRYGERPAVFACMSTPEAALRSKAWWQPKP